MELKDYYSILELTPAASAADIKKAYRRLALQYHPDKNANDHYAAARFAAVKEAYETLTNPLRKNDYLQQRWYAQSRGNKASGLVSTPETVLKQLLDLDLYTSRQDIHRFDKAGLYHRIERILSAETMDMLRSFNEKSINDSIVHVAGKISLRLSADHREWIITKLEKLETTGQSRQQLNLLAKKITAAERWEKRKIWLILLIVSAICIIIYLSEK